MFVNIRTHQKPEAEKLWRNVSATYFWLLLKTNSKNKFLVTEKKLIPTKKPELRKLKTEYTELSQ